MYALPHLAACALCALSLFITPVGLIGLLFLGFPVLYVALLVNGALGFDTGQSPVPFTLVWFGSLIPNSYLWGYVCLRLRRDKNAGVAPPGPA
jgi:hypothetical protein